MSRSIRSFAFQRYSFIRSIQPIPAIIRSTHSQSHSDGQTPETSPVTLEMLYKEIQEQKQIIQKVEQYQEQQIQKETQRILEENQRHWLVKFFHNLDPKIK